MNSKDKPEYITCAAIWYDDDITYPHGPFNIKTGIVVCGHRHHDCIHTHSALTGKRTRHKDIQGFMTSKNRFVNRKEGGEIAFAAGQIDRLTTSLMSELIY